MMGWWFAGGIPYPERKTSLDGDMLEDQSADNKECRGVSSDNQPSMDVQMEQQCAADGDKRLTEKE